MAAHDAFRATVTNFFARLLVALSFVVIVVLLPSAVAPLVTVVWGTALLAGLTFVLARARRVSSAKEIAKHLLVAAVVIGVSRVLGAWIAARVQ